MPLSAWASRIGANQRRRNNQRAAATSTTSSRRVAARIAGCWPCWPRMDLKPVTLAAAASSGRSGSWDVSGDAQVRSDTSPASGSEHARLRRSSGDLQRTVDVSGFADIRLQFAAKLFSFEGSDRADVKVSGDGSTWTTLQSFFNGDDNGQYSTYDLAVPDVGDTLHVRFDAGMSGGADYWFIDDVQVVGTQGPIGPPQITISYPDFSDPSGLNLVGRAAIADGNTLRIVPDENGGPGAAWYVADKQFVSVDWETTFEFNLNQNSGAIDGSDGFTFAIQNHDANYVSGGGGGLGYNSLLNSLVVEFDTFQNSENADPGPSHISIHTNGTGPNGPNETFSIASANTPTIIDDAANHSVKITYTPGTLTVFLDDLATPFLTAPVDLAQLLDLDLGRAWVGFTGATGGGLQNHDILNWDFRLFANTTTAIAVANTEVIEGDSGLTDLVFTVSRLGDTSGTSLVDWATANGTATSGSDYVGNAGQITFNPGDTRKTLTVSVNGDTLEESHETVFLNLSNAIGAALVDNLAVGTILNDDASVLINDTAAVEGDESTLFIDQFISTAGDGLFGPNAMTIGPDGNFYVAGQNSSNVLRYDAATGNLIDVFIPSGSGVDNPRGLAFDADGNLYVPSQFTDAVLRFQGPFGANPGQLIDTFVSPGDGGLNVPFNLAFGPDGNLYVNSARNDSVLRFQGPAGSNPGQFIDAFVAAASGGLDGPTDLLFAADGTLYVGSLVTDSVLRYQGPAAANPGQFIDAFVATGSGGLDGPVSLAFDADGNLHVSSYLTNSVLRYEGPSSPNPGQFMDAVVPRGGGGLESPRAVRFGTDGNLYVVSKTNNEVLRYGAASQAVFTVSLSSPVGTKVTVDYATLDVTAVGGSDYTDMQGSLTFPGGTTELTILVPTIDDVKEENTETFSVGLSNPIGALIPDPTPAVGVILDDDASNQPPLVDAGDDQTLTDVDNNGTEDVTLSGFAFDLDGSIAFAEWTLDGNSLGNTPILNTTLPVGVHTITLTATDNEGTTGSDTVVVTINAAPTEVVLFEDSFEVGNNSNDWNGKWVEDSQNDYFRSTQRATDGSRSAEVDGWAFGATLNLATPIDLTNSTSNMLTFDWLIEKGFDHGESLSLDVSTNGGSSWNYDVRRLRGNVDAENTWHSESVDLGSFASSNLLIRFRTYVSSSREDANIDNVQIIGLLGSGGGGLSASLPTGSDDGQSSDENIGSTQRVESVPAMDPMDVNQDGHTTPLDALLVVNWLNQPEQSPAPDNLDTNRDGHVSPIDTLLIVNELNEELIAEGESASPAIKLDSSLVDSFFSAREEDEDDVLDSGLRNLF